MKHDSPARRALYERLHSVRYRTWKEHADALGMSSGGLQNICNGKCNPSWRIRVRLYLVTGIHPRDWGPVLQREFRVAALPLPKLPRHRCSRFEPACAGQCPRDAVSIVNEGLDHD
jgi:hypothetical protein